MLLCQRNEQERRTDCFREHYITWRGLILFLQRISQKDSLQTASPRMH